MRQECPGTGGQETGVPGQRLGIMRGTIKNRARWVVAATILAAGIGYVNRDALRARYHFGALRVIARILVSGANPPRTFVEKLQMGFLHTLSSKRPHQEWWKCRDHHEEALVRLGYLSRHEFAFTNQTRAFNAVQLMTNAQSRFSTRMTRLCVLTNGQPLSATSICTSSVVRVTAPGKESEKWRALVFELDQKTR